MNFNNDIPIYLQIVDFVMNDISSGKLKPGDKLLSVREYSTVFKVNPNTICKALAILEEKKIIYTERTNGKFVTTNKELIEKIKKELAEEKVNNYLQDMKNIGISYKEAIDYLQELGGDK